MVKFLDTKLWMWKELLLQLWEAFIMFCKATIAFAQFGLRLKPERQWTIETRSFFTSIISLFVLTKAFMMFCVYREAPYGLLMRGRRPGIPFYTPKATPQTTAAAPRTVALGAPKEEEKRAISSPREKERCAFLVTKAEVEAMFLKRWPEERRKQKLYCPEALAKRGCTSPLLF